MISRLRKVQDTRGHHSITQW